MSLDANSEMFEEIKSHLIQTNKKIEELLTFRDNQQTDTLDENDIINKAMKLISDVDQLNVEKMLEDIESKLDKTQKKVIYNVSELKNIIRENTNHKHRHSFDIKSSKIFIMTALSPLLFLGIFIHIDNLTNKKNRFKNNDIKYRYIKMTALSPLLFLGIFIHIDNLTNKKK